MSEPQISPAVAAIPSRRRHLDADFLTRADIIALLDACPPSWVGARNRALLLLAWRCGLRCSELIDLQVKDIDLDERALIVQHGKNDRRRAVGLDAETALELGTWLTTRGNVSGDRLFPTRRGDRLDSSYLRHLLPRLARAAGVQKRVHMHGLRHRFAIELEQEGATLSAIRDLLGHSSIATTDTYLRRAGASRAVAFARARRWS